MLLATGVGFRTRAHHGHTRFASRDGRLWGVEGADRVGRVGRSLRGWIPSRWANRSRLR